MKKFTFYLFILSFSLAYSQNYFNTTTSSANSSLDLSHLGTFTLGSTFEGLNDPWRSGEGRVLEGFMPTGNVSMRFGNNYGKFTIAIAGNDGAFFPTAKRGNVVLRSHTTKKIYFSLNNTSNDGTSAFVFGDNLNHKTLGIFNNGRVGIGTDVPDEKLTVKGRIHAQEVKIDLNGAVAPDYVFKENYDLKPLEEVENYINQNYHLPDIPSAKEMEENGLYLKQLNLKLLQKIEELTLYTIQQQKQLETKEKAISELKNKTEKQENIILKLDKRLQQIELLLSKN